MSFDKNILLNPIWQSQELFDFDEFQESELKLLSIHDHVINFYSPKSYKIFAIASPSLYRGPFAVGLDASSFNKIAALIAKQKFSRIAFQKEQLTLIFDSHDDIKIQLNRGQSSDFSVVNLMTNKSNKNFQRIPEIKKYAAEFTKQLHKYNNSDSQVLLDNSMTPANYFQKQIQDYFPTLITGLLQNENRQNLEHTADQLIGLGKGSTPTGDDMIHGCLLGVHLINNLRGKNIDLPPFEKIGETKTTKLGCHMLSIGRMGTSTEPVLSLIDSIVNNLFINSEQISQLQKIGNFTGLDVATGLVLTINSA